MSEFTTPLILMESTKENYWILYEEFIYHVGTYPSLETIRVPKYFETDFASIPKLFWNILPPYGRYGKAAVVHDYLYFLGISCLRTRENCDLIFLEAMTVLKVNWFIRNVMYYAVRCFGNSRFTYKI